MNNPIDSVRQMFPADTHDKVLLVGGCVRDVLQGCSSSDIDLVSTLTADEIKACGFRLITGKSTTPVWFRHDASIGSIEATLIPDWKDLTSDLARRDFTINAMAMSLEGDVIDPLNGMPDLNLRLLRSCSPRTFCADPLRIFRALRFESGGWEMFHETELLIREHDWSRMWSAIPIERFSRELLKAIQLQAPERFFQRMLELKAGAEYLPEIFRMPHIPAGPRIHHPEGDLFTHAQEVLQRVATLSTDPLTRFCAFFHDIGKLATNPVHYPRHHGHDQAGFEAAIEMCRRLRLPAQYGKSLAWISRLHGTFNLWGQLRDATKLRVAEQAIRAGIVEILPLVAAADKVEGCEPAEWRMTVETASLSSSRLGLEPDYLDSVPTNKRADVILQARIETLRNSVRGGTTGALIAMQ